MKLALIFCADDKGKYTLTKNNILIGSFRNDKDEYRKIGQFVLVNYPEFTNAPKGMKFYSIYPSNHEAQAIVGISDKKIILSGSQIRIKDYKQLLEHGKEYSTQKVYDKVKNNRALPELANKMHVSNQLPISMMNGNIMDYHRENCMNVVESWLMEVAKYINLFLNLKVVH